MKKCWLLCICIVLLLLPGCREKVTVVQNEDDGQLRLDEQHTIDFYLGNEEAGADPITEQCIGIIGSREPDAVEDQEWAPGSVAYTYHINGATIRILQYGEAPAQEESSSAAARAAAGKAILFLFNPLLLPSAPAASARSRRPRRRPRRSASGYAASLC